MLDEVTIRREVAADVPSIRQVTAAAFANQPVVPELVDTLRRSTAWLPDLSCVAAHDAEIVGHVLATRGWLDAPHALLEVLVLSPLSVRPDRQRRGIGTRLVEHLLSVAAAGTMPAIFLEGAPKYYSRFGFAAAGEVGYRRPSLRIPPAAFQVKSLPAAQPGLSGTLVYPEPFWTLDCVGLR